MINVQERTIKKVSLRLLPFVMICYVVAQLDRINIGFAALEMNAELALSAEVFGLLSGIFFIGYFMFEIPSNMILYKVGARVWIARIMISWGILSILTGFVQTEWHLYILRFLLGVAEAGFLPGILLYLTYWFRKRERAIATSILLLAIPIASIIGSPMSTWIMDVVNWAELSGWRWMFVLEGLPAVVLGIVVLFYLTNRPKEAMWLTKEERDWLEGELDKEREEAKLVNKASRKEMLKDKRVYLLTLLYFTNYTAMFGLSFWLPSIVKSLSENVQTNLEIGWLAMIPPIIGIPANLILGWIASKNGSHRQMLILSFGIAAIGFAACGFANSSIMMVILLAFTAIGLYGFMGVFFAYMTFFFTERTAPVGIALVNSFASIGGFVGPMMFGLVSVSLGMFILSGLAIIGLSLAIILKPGKEEKDEAANVSIT
jgi:MFS transporter, ACS family, tartrate transporter